VGFSLTYHEVRVFLFHLFQQCGTRDTPDITNAKMLAREEDWFQRGVKEAIYIRKEAATLNWDEGATNCPRWGTTFCGHCT
jgi:hypothetical protein